MALQLRTINGFTTKKKKKKKNPAAITAATKVKLARKA